MKHVSPAFLSLSLVLSVVSVSCRSGPSGDSSTDRCDSSAASGSTTALSPGERSINYAVDAIPARTLRLPSPLREASGLALSADGRLFAHNDERGTVYQVDTADGHIVKRFAVGEWRLREDLEDLVIIARSNENGTTGGDSGIASRSGDTAAVFYFVNSGGDLFSFTEGEDRANVPFRRIKTPLGSRNNVEGLCYDPDTRTLLLACKEYPGKDLGKVRAVYAYSLREDRLLPEPRFLIDLRELKRRFDLKEFQPSGIALHPLSGNFFIISAAGNSIIEISPAGKILSYAHLNKRYNEQPEGIRFAEDGTLYIANEGRRKGMISVYTPE